MMWLQLHIMRMDISDFEGLPHVVNSSKPSGWYQQWVC